VAYYFARDLHAKLGVPVGIISTSWGGTPAQAWTSAEGFAGQPELKGYADQLQAAEVLPENGHQNFPAALYNAMIAPVVPYGMKGVIWYQGEANAGQSKQYQTLFPAMIADWRAKWKLGDFPFLFVQIAPFKGLPPEIREAQLLTLAKSKNTAMAVTTDCGDANDIHPKQKEPVGHRLSLAARALAYSEKIEYSGPLYQEMKAAVDKAWISFSHAGGGLVAKDGDLKGFTIAGADGKFVPAKAEIKGDKVVVSAEGVSDPKAVRYGWDNVPGVNLFNKEGLPASPFRTDLP
jgi:sialate O-acetylesterase